MTQEEQPLGQQKKKALLAPENPDSDLIWAAKRLSEGVNAFSKILNKKKLTPEQQAEHNAKLIEQLKASIKAKKEIKSQREEYDNLVTELKKLQKEEWQSRMERLKQKANVKKV